MRYLIITALLFINSFALSPFSLEGFKEANVKVLTKKNKLISKEFKQKLLDQIKKELEKHGIKTKSDNFSNFLLKIETLKIDESIAVNLTLFLVEDVYAARDKSIENMGITYRKNDFFDTTKEDFETDVYESAIEFLLYDMLEQYRDENS